MTTHATRYIAAFGRLVRAQGIGLLALFLVLTAGAAYASGVAKNSVTSSSIKNGQVKTPDLATGAVKTRVIAPDAVTGDGIDESTLSTVPDAAQLAGIPATGFVRASVYKKESVLGPGTVLGDGTFVAGVSCNAGDILLSGGVANVNPTSDLLETFPTPGGVTGWSGRIQKNGSADDFSVVAVCANQG